MKRRLAVLLALTLTFASLSPAGAAAAEATTAQAQIVEDVYVTEEIAGEEAAQEEPAPESEESAQEAAAVTGAAEEETQAVVEEKEETKEQGEDETEDAAAAGTTAASAETAQEEEPAEPAEEAPAENATEEAAVIEEAVVEEVAVEAKKATRTGEYFQTNPKNGKKSLYDNGKLQEGKGWYTHANGNTYYIDAEGAVATGFVRLSGKTYYFWDSRCKTRSALGVMMTGWHTIDGHKYYFNIADTKSRANGAMYTGWRKVGGKMYFFANSLFPSLPVGTMVTGFKTIEGKKYYFGTDGVRRTGFEEIDGKKYYFVDKNYSEYTAAKEGMMLTYSKKIGGKYYYFSQYGYCRTGWVKVGKLAAFFKDDGTAAIGWKEKNGNWYYLKETGIAQTGWLKLSADSIFYLKGANAGRMINEPTVMSNGKLYFFGEDGRRATTEGWKGNGAYYYYTYANGTCAVNTTIDKIKLDEYGRTTMTKMDMKAQGYSSNTNYLILVDKSTYTVCVYKGKKGAWLRIKGEWPCTHGGSLTPEGEKTIKGRLTKRSETWGWADFEYSSAAFTMELSSGNFMHSVLFEKGTRGNPYNQWIMDNNMYRNYSKGCIRLQLQNAEWVWDNIPSGTKVVVYRS